MALNDESERAFGTTLAAILVAIATFCLTIMALTKEGYLTVSNEVFGLLGLGALLTSTLILDAILDKAQCSFSYRSKELLNGGYFLFAIIMSGISFAILYLYHAQENPAGNSGWTNIYILFIICSVIQWFKLMMDDREHVLGWALGGAYFVSILAIKNWL